MQFRSQLFLLALGLMPLTFAQLETIGVTTSGVSVSSHTTSLPSTSLLSSTLSTSSSSISFRTPTFTDTTITTAASSEDPLVLTTVFTQPPGCSGGMTMVASWGTELWQNIVNPVPSLTLSSCYPSQFYYSAMATTTLAPYRQLVCPQDWETYNVTETYIICCPRGYGLFAPNYQNATRPGLGAVCTSSIWPSVLMDITSYDSTAFATVIPTVAGPNGALVFATAFDGMAATSVASSISTAAPSTVPATGSITAPSTLSSTSALSIPSTSSTTVTATLTAISQLPSCGQTCFNDMLAEYESLGCGTSDPSCLCRNINFYYGIRDCANAACGTDVASTVLAFESGYCTSAIAAETTYPVTATVTAKATPTATSDLSPCGQTCFDNMLAQYTALGCSSTTDASCLCANINFYYGLRDCSNQACNTDEAAAVLAYESYYCAAARV